MGTLIKSIHGHQADVLCLAASSDGRLVFSSGIDQQVSMFRYLENGQWVITSSRREHSHDVYALALSSDSKVLVSGGLETRLCTYKTNKFEEKNISKKKGNEASKGPAKRLPPVPYKSLIKIAPSEKLLLCQYSTALQLWKLGAGETLLPLSGFHHF